MGSDEIPIATLSAAGGGITREDTPLLRRIEVDALSDLPREGDQDVRITTDIRGYRVEFTPGATPIHGR